MKASPAPASALLALGALVLATGCSADREATADAGRLDMDACFAAIAGGDDADEAVCPPFLLATAIDAGQICREAGGSIGPIEAADIWSIDVNGDERPEHAFALDEIVHCEGAPSLFSCGSLGCPKALYGERDGTWRLIGSLSALSRDDIALSNAVHADGYRDLVVGCSTAEECVRWTYAWRDDFYEPVEAVVRGYRVESAESVHGLFALAADTTLLATPSADGATLDRYAAGTEVAIVGTAGDYYYVSPCNACASGFVAAALIPSAR